MNPTLKTQALAALLALLCSGGARAEGLDRDALVSEAPAVPDKGTVRIAGSGYAQKDDAGNTGGITGSVQWTPIDRLAGDVGIYLQGQGAGVNADNGPQARLRFQVLRQRDYGVDLSLGIRFKKIGFYKVPNDGEPDGEYEAGSAPSTSSSTTSTARRSAAPARTWRARASSASTPSPRASSGPTRRWAGCSPSPSTSSSAPSQDQVRKLLEDHHLAGLDDGHDLVADLQPERLG